MTFQISHQCRECFLFLQYLAIAIDISIGETVDQAGEIGFLEIGGKAERVARHEYVGHDTAAAVYGAAEARLELRSVEAYAVG